MPQAGRNRPHPSRGRRVGTGIAPPVPDAQRGRTSAVQILERILAPTAVLVTLGYFFGRGKRAELGVDQHRRAALFRELSGCHSEHQRLSGAALAQKRAQPPPAVD